MLANAKQFVPPTNKMHQSPDTLQEWSEMEKIKYLGKAHKHVTVVYCDRADRNI